MKNSREFFKNENEKVMMEYESCLAEIKAVCHETQDLEQAGELKELYSFFNHTGSFILKLAEIERKLNDEYFVSKTIQELKLENYELYKEVIGENYKVSYANPSYCVSLFGDKLGQLLSVFYVGVRNGISHAYRHKVFSLHNTNVIFMELYNNIKSNGVDYEAIKSVVIKPYFNVERLVEEVKVGYLQRMDSEYDFYVNNIASSENGDMRYLFKMDKYITDNEIKTVEFLQKYPKEKIEMLSKSTVDAFIRGFVTENKDRKNRDVVRLIYSAGQEIILNQVIKDLKKAGFRTTVAMVLSTDANKQYEYDHRFDEAVYFGEEYAKLKEEAQRIAHEEVEDVTKHICGVLIFESFGEKPFAPENKKECLKLSEQQEKLKREHSVYLDELWNKYMPEENRSFCIIAFPSPEIGEKFEAIFEDTLSINMMNNAEYEPIQQAIIDALDKGEVVHIKGYKGNETDIKVKLHELKNPEKETNFVNCVADVNIPLGEVFTSPTLKGTNGVLHLKETFLGLKYENLKLTFEDGYAVDYTCTNFDNAEDNRNYVKENLMELHDKLPLGEFAIGTNTVAYVMAQKYNIIEVLPILIIEKMGPHFAIGDTCFSWAEDLPVYNLLDHKEIVARENEMSALRKEDKNKAYTGVHTDITIPYEEIEFIKVLDKQGEGVDIIREGRFVLKGTEALNKAFE